MRGDDGNFNTAVKAHITKTQAAFVRFAKKQRNEEQKGQVTALYFTGFERVPIKPIKEFLREGLLIEATLSLEFVGDMLEVLCLEHLAQDCRAYFTRVLRTKCLENAHPLDNIASGEATTPATDKEKLRPMRRFLSRGQKTRPAIRSKAARDYWDFIILTTQKT